ncbi:MAG: MnmC family methyltransferase [Cyanobacteriota bacterium]
MTWPACVPDDGGDLCPRRTGDGSFSLWSAAFGEGFHCAEGALAEARATFVEPAGLEHLAAGERLRVVEVAVGTGTNTAALIEAAADRHLALDWWGLELDRRPLALALADGGFRAQWRPDTCAALGRLTAGRLLVGDARRRLADLAALAGSVDLVLHDAYSPRRCPQLWTVEFLAGLARLLAPRGRLLTYSAAAAVRRGLQLADLQLASISPSGQRRRWSGGTAASPAPLPIGGRLRPLLPLECDHLCTAAAEPYRDPTGAADAAMISTGRSMAQAAAAAPSSSAWRRRWQLDHGG